MRNGIKIRQRDITDCGAACLASVAAHHQLLLPVARIRQFASERPVIRRTSSPTR